MELRPTFALVVCLGAALGIAAVAACGDDEPTGAAADTDGGGASSSGGSSSGATSSSGGSSSGSSGADAKVPNVGTWRDYRADAGPMVDDEYVGIFGVGAEDMFLAGNSQPTLGPGGGIYRYSRVDGGLGFRNVHGNSSYHFYDIAGTSTNDVWAVGYQNSSFGWDGGAWGARPSPGFNEAGPIWAAGPGDYWAINRQIPTTLRHFTGGVWSSAIDIGAKGAFYVWGLAGHVFVLGYGEDDDAGDAKIYLYDGVDNAWTPHLIGTKVNPTGIWGAAPNDLFIVGYDGLILRWDGATFTKMTSGLTTERIYAVWGTAADDVFAVGTMKAVLHWDGATWTKEPTPPSAEYMGSLQLLDIWGSAPNDIWAVGDHGAILHRTP
jgi:hypothetical protein